MEGAFLPSKAFLKRKKMVENVHRPSFSYALDPLSVKHYFQEPAVQRNIAVSLIATIVFSLIASSFLSNTFPKPANAASKTWTSTSDFNAWTHSTTKTGANNVTLGLGTNNEAITTMAEVLPSARYGAASIWATSNNKAYLFGGSTNSGATNQII
jgi:hypothetical protein